MAPIRFEHSYAGLPERFYSRIHPEQVPAPQLIRLNEPLAAQFGLDIDWLKSPDGIAMLSGQRLPEGAEPIAMVYAGHQFGGLVPQLGDGRAHLIGELVDNDGVRYDLHLKGSGRTPYSRQGDGKAALGPVLREYIVSEAFAALGIPSSRTLAATLTGEPVLRETALPGAVLARVAQSHVRVGTFQYFAIRGDLEGVTELADYVIERHYPELREAENPYLALFEAVAMRQARLIARWMGVGFIHGVMNTDNMQVAGETIDFGPCAFMDRFHPDKVFSSIDATGRYAWNRQPKMAKWNLARLAEALLPLFDAKEAQAIAAAEEALERFSDTFDRHWLGIFSNKLGLEAEADGGNGAFIADTLNAMTIGEVDFTLFFRRLTELAGGEGDNTSVAELFNDQGVAEAWLNGWQQRRAATDESVRAMREHNPVYIPRNHRIEQAIEAALGGDFRPFHALVDVLANPYVAQSGCEPFELPPEPHEEVQETFCGT